MAKSKKKRDQERRRHSRVDLKLLIQHRFETFEDFMEEVATNISASGLFLKTDKPHPAGSTIYLRFALADGLPLIEGIGKVVRVNEPDSDPDRTPGMGIEFVSLDDESRLLIESIIHERFSE